MNVRCLSRTLLVLLTALVVSAAADGRCDAPFKTLSSDCRDAQYGANVLCVVNDQRGGQLSPCTTGSLSRPMECAINSGLSCDLLSYKINYTPTQARFQITFLGDTSRSLKLVDATREDTRVPVASALHRSRVASMDNSSMSGSGSGEAVVTPPSRETDIPPATPQVTLHKGALVDFTSAPTPSPDEDGASDSFQPILVPTNPPSGFRGDDPPVVASESNEFVQAIGALRLGDAVTEMRIIGGSSEFGTRGKAVKLSIDPQMLTQSQQVSSLSIVNCDIGDQLSTGSVLSGMPTGLTDLNLRNTRMRAEPSDLSALQNLRRKWLVLLTALVVSAAADGRCDAPFKTLSSDCRDAQYGANVLCVVNDQRGGQLSPCTTGSLSRPMECAINSGLSCDLLSYKINYTPTQARFQITFLGDTSRSLKLVDATREDTRVPVASALHRSRVASMDNSSMSGSGSGEAVVTPPSRETDIPPATPQVTLHKGALVDFTSAPTPSPDEDGASDSFQPILVPTNPPSGFRGDDPPVVASESNEFVQAIGALRLGDAVTEMRIIGGSSEFGTRGKAVKLSIDPQMLTQSQQVSSLSIVNCDIGDQLSTGSVLSGMPTGLTDLNLRNTRMRAEPSDLSALQNLRSLKMDQNYMTTFSSKVSLQELAMLDLSDNLLTKFEANLPALESLYLNKNNFNAIPEVIYSMSKLQELYLSENPIAAIVVSASQAKFLARLRLKIDIPSSSTPPAPVIYVPGPTSDSPSASASGLVLDGKGADLSNAVAVPVGSLVDLHGLPVWQLSDVQHDVFRAQQDVISKSTIIIGGEKTQSYQAKAAEAVLKATTAVPNTVTPSSMIVQPSRRDELPGGPTTEEPSSHDGPASSSSTGEKDTANAVRHPSSLDSQNTAATGTKSHKVVVLSLAVVAVVAGLAIAAMFLHRRRRSHGKAVDSSSSTVATPRDGSPPATYQAAAFPDTKPTNSRDSLFGSLGATFVAMHDVDVEYLFSSRRIRAAELADVRVIGAGSACTVWLVKWGRSRLLAAKRLVDSVWTNQRMAEFVSEIVIAADLEHPNIVHLVGIAWTSQTDLQALFEYMPNGDLEAYLHSMEPTSLTWSSVKLKLATDIVEALVYTHSFSPPLLHRDLRARSVLLDEDINPKLSNFGSARYASEQNTMTTNGIGSGRWLAPEILSGRTDYDSASDVYAFGVLLCELDSHTTPYEGVRDVNDDAISETALLGMVARGVLRPTFSVHCPLQIQELARHCMAQDPRSRPSAVQVAYELRLCK